MAFAQTTRRPLSESAAIFLPQWQNTTSSLVDRVYSILIGNADSRASVRRCIRFMATRRAWPVRLISKAVFETFESDLASVCRRAGDPPGVCSRGRGWLERAGDCDSGAATAASRPSSPELVRAGATYYSDEYAVLDSRGRVHPFSKPIELREEGKFQQRKVTATEFGGRQEPNRCRLAWF